MGIDLNEIVTTVGQPFATVCISFEFTLFTLNYRTDPLQLVWQEGVPRHLGLCHPFSIHHRCLCRKYHVNTHICATSLLNQFLLVLASSRQTFAFAREDVPSSLNTSTASTRIPKLPWDRRVDVGLAHALRSGRLCRHFLASCWGQYLALIPISARFSGQNSFNPVHSVWANWYVLSFLHSPTEPHAIGLCRAHRYPSSSSPSSDDFDFETFFRISIVAQQSRCDLYSVQRLYISKHSYAY
jgi:hypothetical protein